MRLTRWGRQVNFPYFGTGRIVFSVRLLTRNRDGRTFTVLPTSKPYHLVEDTQMFVGNALLPTWLAPDETTPWWLGQRPLDERAARSPDEADEEEEDEDEEDEDEEDDLDDDDDDFDDDDFD